MKPYTWRSISTLSVASLFLLMLPWQVRASVKPIGANPRIANYFLKWHLSDQEVDALSRWDIVILDPETQENTRAQLEKLHAMNPRPLILAYITSQEIRKNAADLTEAPLRRALAGSVPDSWYLTDTKGNRTSWWPGASLLNVTDQAAVINGQRWNTFLPRWLTDNVLSSGLWDGAFLDNAWGYLSWIPYSNSFDTNRDGVAESRQDLDQQWKAGMEMIVRELRRRNPTLRIFGNSIKFGPNIVSSLDGAMLENFPDPGWTSFMQSYRSVEAAGGQGFITIINGNTANRGAMSDYRSFRYTLASTLLGNGEVSFDFGDSAHEQLWSYDEYVAPLGTPTGPPSNLREFRQTNARAPGLWRRDFTRGVILVNSTESPQSTSFESPLDRLLGSPGPGVNSGAEVTDVAVPAHDGIVLLKPVSDLVGVVFRVGSFARVFDANGAVKRRGFFPNAPATEGGTLRWIGDLDGDGKTDTIRADQTAVTISFGNGAKKALLPYGPRYVGAVNFAVGDLNGDGRPEIVTGALHGGAQVQIFDASGRHVGGFFAFPGGGSGVRVAIGDLDGDHRADILTTRAGTPSSVRAYSAAGVLKKEFRGPSVPAGAGGYTLAAADLNGDGRAEVLVGTGVGAVAQLAIQSADGTLLKQFGPLSISNKSGFLIGVVDVDGNGSKEIVVMAERIL